MTKKAEQGEATPAVVPGYGEADGEAASMDKAAHEGKTGSKADAAATEVAEQPVPDTAGPVGYGTSETDVKKRIAETASRKAAPDAAG